MSSLICVELRLHTEQPHKRYELSELYLHPDQAKTVLIVDRLTQWIYGEFIFSQKEDEASRNPEDQTILTVGDFARLTNQLRARYLPTFHIILEAMAIVHPRRIQSLIIGFDANVNTSRVVSQLALMSEEQHDAILIDVPTSTEQCVKILKAEP